MQVQHSKSSVSASSPGHGHVGSLGAQCRNVTVDEPCYDDIVWAMRTGISSHPDWYPELSATSSWDDFQRYLHNHGHFDCPEPCGYGTPPPGATSPGAVFQEGALIPTGGEISFYTVGTSNVVWESWPDQVHSMLKRLGYSVPTAEFDLASLKQPTQAPRCDDASELSELDTPRVGRVGWSSWGFAFESKDDCGENGFRDILGHEVSCTNAWACNPAWAADGGLVRPSEIAEEAQHSDVVIISNWVNDAKHRYSNYVCFGGEQIDALASTNLTVASLRKLIQAIHARNPDVTVLIMASYPNANGLHTNEWNLPDVAALNAAVESGITRSEPNTFFVSYAFPAEEDMYQTMHGGHPNCRGDRVMATAVLETLFRSKVLSKGLALDDSEQCLSSGACSGLSLACCQRSALCHVAADLSCLPYGPGQQ